MKGLTFSLVFLGVVTKVSGKTGKLYSIAKFMDQESNDVFEFFVKGDEILKQTKKLKPFTLSIVFVDISSFQGQPKINFVGVESK